MGQPVFEVEDIIKEHDIQVFSSNYTLYATMSDRVMRVLSQFSPTLEVYSIDEAFADLTPLAIDDLTEYGKTIKARSCNIQVYLYQLVLHQQSVYARLPMNLSNMTHRMKASWISLH